MSQRLILQLTVGTLAAVASFYPGGPAPLSGQILDVASADSVDGRPVHRGWFGAWFKLNGIYDFVGIPNNSALNLPSIPVGDDGVKDPTFTMDVWQSHLVLGSEHRLPESRLMHSYFEFDFFGGGGGGVRVRHAYLDLGEPDEGGSFRIGQYWSTFGDDDAWPNVTDFDGPTTGVWIRQPMLRYQRHLSSRNRFQVAIETSTVDPNRFAEVDSLVEPTNQNIPDVMANYRFSGARSHVQVGGIFRNLRFVNSETDEREYDQGYGLTVSGRLFVGSHGDVLTYQAVGGKGIAQYIVGFSGQGFGIIPDPEGGGEPLPVYGGYAAYQHFWSPKTSSTGGAGFSVVSNELFDEFGDVFEGIYLSANLYCHARESLNLAVEVLYGTHTTPTLDEPQGAFGSAGRVQFVTEYAF